MNYRSRSLLTVFLAATFAATTTTSADSFAANAPRHLVFAHYMVCYGGSVEFYKSEIELAQRHRHRWLRTQLRPMGRNGYKTQSLSPAYAQSCERMYEAAKQLNSGFRLFISADVNGLGDLMNNMGDMVTRFEHHPNQFRYQNKTVLSAWGGTRKHSRACRSLKNPGHPVCFIPFLMNQKYAMAWSFETSLKFLTEPAAHGRALLLPVR